MSTFRAAYNEAQRKSRKRSEVFVVVADDCGGYKAIPLLDHMQNNKRKAGIIEAFDVNGEEMP